MQDTQSGIKLRQGDRRKMNLRVLVTSLGLLVAGGIGLAVFMSA